MPDTRFDAGSHPFRDRPALIRPTLQRTGDGFRNRDLEAPVAALPPAEMGKIICDRGQGVGYGLPDIAPAVTIEINRMGKIGCRQELRLAKRTRPQDDFIAPAPTSPFSTIFKAAMSSLRNRSLRVDINAFVARTRKALWGIFTRPKPDSRPQTARMIRPGTPYLRSIAASVLAHLEARERPPATRLPIVFCEKITAPGEPNSACTWRFGVFALVPGGTRSGSFQFKTTRPSVALNVADDTPLPLASGQRSCFSQLRNCVSTAFLDAASAGIASASTNIRANGPMPRNNRF